MTSAHGQSRYSFTAQFVAGANLLAKRAAEIEKRANPAPLEKSEHKALVVSAIMQATSSLEADLGELLMYGPGYHLGLSAANAEAQAFITEPLSKLIERAQGVLLKYDALLQLLRKPPLDKGRHPYQDAVLLVALRNALVHYKSEWSDGTTAKGLAKRFSDKGTIPLAQPPFNSGLFPMSHLSAGCAEWASKTAAAFIDAVYVQLDVTSVLDGHRLAGAEFASVMPPRVK